MAAKGTIGGKIVLEGESQYRQALKNIRAEQAELRSEMKLCQASFKENQNSIDALTKKQEILTKQIESQAKKVDVYRQALETSGKKQTEAANKVQELQTALQKAEEEMLQMADSSDVTAEAMEGQQKAIEELKNKLRLAEQDYDKAAQKTLNYQTAMNNAQAEMQGMQSELSKTEKYINEAENSTDGIAKSIDEYGKEVQDATKETSVFGDVLKANLASEAIMEGLRLLIDGMKTAASAAVDVGVAFEAGMSQVAATMGLSAKDIESGSEAYETLSNAAKECGKSTMFSASQAAEALNYLALAGYDATKAAETLPKVLDLAAAGGLDLAYASDLVTDSMAALNMETSRLDDYIDQMAKTSQKSNTSVAQLGEATLVCAGTVSLAKMSIEDMNTELGIMANNGIKGAEGGTHLRNILLSLSAPTETASTAISRLGLRITDSQGDMRKLNDILIDMNAAMSDMSATEKTQIIAKIFNKTDIAAVNALLKGTGDEYNNLYNEITNCGGAAKDMAETLNNNLKGKVTILQSSLEGLGISAFEIFDGPMKKSVEAATDAVGRLQRSVESGDMNASLDKLSKSLEEFCDGAIEVGENALPVMIDGLTWILDNGDLIIAGVTGIAAAQLEMKVVGPAIEACTAAWKTYQLANEGATVSQWLLNTAMSANPAGMLVTAIVGLTAAVGAYAIMNKDNLVILDETTQKTREQVQASRELNSAYQTGAGERAKARETLNNEAAAAKNLVAELKDLSSKTNLTTTEQSRMKMIVQELNGIVPTLNLAIDEQTGKLNMSTDAIEKNVDAMMAMARAEAAREDLTRIAQEQYEAEKLLAELEAQMEEQTNNLTEAQAKYTEELNANQEAIANGTAIFEEYNAGLDYAQQEVTKNEEAQKALAEEIESTKETIAGFTEEYKTTMDYISDTESVATASQGVQDLGASAEQAGSQFSGMSEAMQEALADMQENLSETITKQMNLFDEFQTKTSVSTDQILTNMESQIQGLEDWSNNISELADRGINQGLLKYLADMGPQGAGYVAAFTTMTDEELQKANKLFEESLVIPQETVSKITDAYIEAGKNAGEGLGIGIAEQKEQVEEAAGEVADASLKKTKEVLDSHSPSEETKKIGRDFDAGLAEGIRGDQENVTGTVQNLAAEILRICQANISQSTFVSIGAQIPAGLAQGIQSGQSKVINAVTQMCTEAVKAGNRSLEINSPSKKFKRMGEGSGEGYIMGWQESMKDIDKVIENSLPDTSVIKANIPAVAAVQAQGIEAGQNSYNINQEINIYSQTDDLIETTRKFKQSQREAAAEW